jgi:hypothetical protein
MCVWEADGRGPLVVDDVRRAALAHIKSCALTRWTEKPDGLSLLAGPGMLDLGTAVLKHSSTELQATFLHVATNSIDYHWMRGADRDGQLQRMRCTACAKFLSLDHLAECRGPLGVAFHAGLQRDLLSLLAKSASTSAWLLKHRGRTLLQQLLSLFPCPAPVPSPEYSRHITRSMCGAFTHSQATSASRLLGFASVEDGAPTLLQMRLLCLQHVDTLFRGLKPAALH